MKRFFFLILLSCVFYSATAQYDPGAMNYGFAAIKSFGTVSEVGLGVRMEYASNCYTTFLGEYNRLFTVDSNSELEGYNELALGVNLILFNWYPTTITAGFGYLGNDSSIFEEIEDDALLGFRSGDFNHGVQIKLRALHQVSVRVHVFAELNIKSLGRRYDAFFIGLSYDFDAR